jgi:hypothetical protein
VEKRQLGSGILGNRAQNHKAFLKDFFITFLKHKLFF